MKKTLSATLGLVTWKVAKSYGRRRLRNAGRSLVPRTTR
jgi:hypothetical protein